MKLGVALGWQNSDWDRYDGDDFSRPPSTPDWSIVEENLHLADLVEPLGFDSFFSIEHHMTPYHMTGSGPQLLTYMAGRTERIDLGTGLIVLPWYNPIRLAEQLCFLDNIVGDKRRLWLGVGRGTAPREYRAMGIDQDEARGRFKEVYEILKLAFTEERFSYDGEYFHLDDVSVRPRPRSKHLEERFYAGVLSPPSIEIAARLGMNVMFTNSASWQELADRTDLFNGYRAETELEPVRPIIVTQCVCAETHDQAQELGRKAMGAYMKAATKHYQFDQPEVYANLKGYEQYASLGGRRGGGGVGAAAHGAAPAPLENTLVGTPDEILSRLEWLNSNIRPSQVIIIVHQGSLSIEESEKSLRLFAKEVLPVAQQMKDAAFEARAVAS
jgi:alkanesulfonate monooxygenase SsuD/methylene tetrahydromethanopterin reductase-like flavin-dependent oxidoreductase (luciferase family)